MRSIPRLLAFTVLAAALAPAQGNPDDLLARAQQHFQKGELVPASVLFQEYIRILPGDPRGYLGLGRALAKRRRLAAAADQLLIAHQSDPHNPEILYDLASCLQNQSRFSESIVYWRRLAELSATDERLSRRWEIHYWRGHAAKNLELFPEAIEALTHARLVHSGDPQVEELLASASFDAGHYRETIPILESAIRANPGAAANHYYLGYCLMQSDQAEKAEQEFRRALKLDPKHYESWRGLGQLFMRQQNHAGAYSAFLTAIEHNPRDLEAHHSLAKVLRLRGDAEEAAEIQRKYEELLAESDRLTEQMRAFNRRVAANPRDVAAYFDAATVLIQQNRPGDALPWLMRLLAQDPHHDIAILNVAAILAREGQTDAARLELEKILEDDPSHPFANREMGRLLLTQRQFAAAIPYIERSLERVPEGRAELHQMLAHCYQQVGDAAKAKAHLEQARTAGAR